MYKKCNRETDDFYFIVYETSNYWRKQRKFKNKSGKFMETDRKRFLRKLKTRLEAYNNLGETELQTNVISIGDEKVDKQYSELLKNIEEANESKLLNKLGMVSYKGGITAKINRGMKKLIRRLYYKLFGWLVIPMIDSQNTYNGKMYNSMLLMKDIMIQQQMMIQQQNDMLLEMRTYLNNKYDNAKHKDKDKECKG